MSLLLYSSWTSMVPWLVFAICDRNGGVGATDSAVLATVAAVGLLLAAWRARIQRPLLYGGVVIFGALAILLEVQHHSAVGEYSRTLAVGILAAVLGTSALTTPVTLHHLRRRVSPSRAATLEFVRRNRQLTGWWFACAAVAAASFALGTQYRDPGPLTLLNWLVPIFSAFVAGAVTSRVISDEEARLESATVQSALGTFEVRPTDLRSVRHLRVVDSGDV